jgi:NACHT domain
MSTTGVHNAQYTDARHGRFTHIIHNQHISNTTSSAETLLNSLKPVRFRRFVMPCMKGTREGVFQRIDSWLDDFDVHNILLISGCPGVGKSAIMSSLESRLRTIGRCSASFFFDRGDASLSDPTALWRTIASDLARKYPSVATRLLKNLQDGKVDPGRPDIDLHFKYLIEEPLSYVWVSATTSSTENEGQDARKADNELLDGMGLAAGEQLENSNRTIKPPVIIIDALDECCSDDSQRNVLFNTLTSWSHLHPSVKLVVTSRDERIPPSFVNVCDHIVLETGDLVSSEENDDIQTFMEYHFAQITSRYPSLPPTWPGHSTIKRLTECAAGLFIWADTAVKYIEQGIATEQLDLILAGHFREGNRIDALYRQILDTSFKDTKSQICQKFKAVVGAIVLAKTPLRDVDIKHFIGQRIDRPSIDFILQKLSSVLSMGSSDGCVHVSHVSFTEFVCDSERCHAKFAIPRSTHSGIMALACLQNMNRGLKFNICRLETSYRRNDEIPDLPTRIDNMIPPCLLYSCRYFAEHLNDSSNNAALLKEIESFLYTTFLYWLEVMSLCNHVPEAVTALHILTGWLEVSPYDLFNI